MIAKIGRSSKLYSALAYNHLKVEQGNAKILFTNNMIETPDNKYTIPKLIESFEPYLVANKNTEKHTLHISLNPDPNDKVSDPDFVKMAEDYMNGMGYGKQPYIVFKHTDIDRTHIHIVSVGVDEYGKKISDKFEKKRSMEICRKLERSYNLLSATEQKKTENKLIFSPVDYQAGNSKNQIASVIRNIADYYSFKTLGEYNALLSLFNINAEKIEGKLHGKPQRGLIYFALDKNKQNIGHPFKASIIGKMAGLNALELHFLKSKELVLNSSNKSEIKAIIDDVLKSSNNERAFIEKVKSKGINTVIRRNETGRIYGITFIDHNSRTVWNGSSLGKQYSANIFNDLWKNQQTHRKTSDLKQQESQSVPTDKFFSAEIHSLFGFLSGENNNNIYKDENSLPGFLPMVQGEDHEDEIFAQQMMKRKKRRKR